jgi:hypothetical protein|nr:MAG TPA: hypothetical protein [Crassvirales sp.]
MKRNTKEENRDHKSSPRYTEKDLQMLYTIKQVLRLVHDGVKQKDIISMKITSASIVSSIFWGLKGLNIIMTTGYGTGFSYRWVENRKCGNLAAITILQVVRMHQSIRNYRYRLKKEDKIIDLKTYRQINSKTI